MKIDFLPQLQMQGGFNAGGAAGSAGGILGAAAGMTPWGAIGQAGIGLIQGIGGFIQNRRALNKLENMQSPTYKQSGSILDYYNKALAKYNVNPYQSDYFRMQQQLGNRAMGSGLNALQGRGMALAGVNNLVQQQSDRLLRAGATAEDLQRQDLARLGQASGMKTAEQQRAFDINEMQPFERRYNLLAMKAKGGTDIANAGVYNLGQGLLSADQYRMLNKSYG